MPEVATPNQAERKFETGSDQFFKHRSQVNAGRQIPHRRPFHITTE